jgi:hypothetical protein
VRSKCRDGRRGGALRRPSSFLQLGSSVDPLFETRPADNLFAIAEAGLRAGLAMLVPERGDSSVELAEPGGEDGVVSGGQTLQETGALLA